MRERRPSGQSAANVEDRAQQLACVSWAELGIPAGGKRYEGIHGLWQAGDGV